MPWLCVQMCQIVELVSLYRFRSHHVCGCTRRLSPVPSLLCVRVSAPGPVVVSQSQYVALIVCLLSTTVLYV